MAIAKFVIIIFKNLDQEEKNLIKKYHWKEIKNFGNAIKANYYIIPFHDLLASFMILKFK